MKNTYQKHDIDYSKLGMLGELEGQPQGKGLHNVRAITDAYDNVVLDTVYEGGYFTQQLEIYE